MPDSILLTTFLAILGVVAVAAIVFFVLVWMAS